MQGLQTVRAIFFGMMKSWVRGVRSRYCMTRMFSVFKDIKLITFQGAALKLFLFLAVSVAFTAQATTYPLTVTDDLGREVTLSREPYRIVTMKPSQTETLCALGACDKLVGVDSYSDYPEAVRSLPKLGSALSPNLEAIVASRPDLILVDESSELAQRLAKTGIPVYAGTAQSFDEVFEKFQIFGIMVNRETEAALLTGRVEGVIRAIRKRASQLKLVSVYYEIDDTPYSVGPESFIGELLTVAGGKNIVSASLGDFPRLEPEYIVAANPSVIIVNEDGAKSIPKRAGWSRIEAVRQARIVPTDQFMTDSISRPGPRMVEAVRFFARALHPEAFGEPLRSKAVAR